VVDAHLAVDELPQEVREAALLLDDALPGLSIGDGRLDLAAVADDAGVGQQLGDLSLVVGNFSISPGVAGHRTQNLL